MDAIDEVIRLIRSSQGREDARPKLMEFLDIDQVQADAILSMQLVRLANMERQKIIDEHEELMRKIADYNDILAKPERQRTIVGDELDEIVAKYGDERRTKILPYSGEDERRRPDRRGERGGHRHALRLHQAHKPTNTAHSDRGGKGHQGRQAA